MTTSHQDHRFTELETVLQEKRESMQKELNNLETNILKIWQNLMKEARKVTSDFLGQVNGIEKELEERAKEFHKRVEEIKENFKTQLNEMKTSNLAILHEQEKRVSNGLEKVKLEIKECEDRLRSTDMESLLEYEGAKSDKKDTLPKLSSANPPSFISSQIDITSLTEMFGQLNVPKTNQPASLVEPSNGTSPNTQKSSKTSDTKKPIIPDTTHSTAARHNIPSQAAPRDTQTHDTTAPIKPPTHLIPKPSVQSQFRILTNYLSVTCVGSGQAWVKTDWKMIQLVDRHGKVKDTMRTDFGFNDTRLSPQGDILLTDEGNKCIKSISPDKKVKTLFKLQWKPSGLCCLHSGDIAITFVDAGRVVIYSVCGKVIKELDKKLFRGPYSVAQSKVNSDLYISDPGGYSDAGKVVVLDKYYRGRYEYAGHDGFIAPHGLCTDNAGRVLITDSINHRVHILDRDGKFLKYLLTREQGLFAPWNIDVDSEGNAWVGGSMV